MRCLTATSTRASRSEAEIPDFVSGELVEQTGWYDFHARMYSPALGRFLAVDPQGQFASPYVGMGNNPAMVVDPDGELGHLAVGALIGGIVNLGVKAYQRKIGSWKDAGAAFGIGAAAGFLTAATGGAIAGAAGLSISTIAGGDLAGSSGAVLGSPVQGLGNAVYFGDPYSAKQFVTDVAVGGVLGGVAGGVAGWLKNVKAAKLGEPTKNIIWGDNPPGWWGPKNQVTIEKLTYEMPDFVHDGKIIKGGTGTYGGTAATKGESVIGPRATYREFAQKIGANFLNVTDEAWTMRKNVGFLQGVVKRGDDVIFSGKFNPAKLDPNSVLGQEIRYLTKHGYSWTDDFSRMIKK